MERQQPINKTKNFSISELCKMIGIGTEVGRMVGKAHLVTLALKEQGGKDAFDHITKCEDVRTMHTGDAEADLAHLLKDGRPRSK